jgi:hypothetical protein
VLGGEVEDDAVRRIAQELFARLLGREHAAFGPVVVTLDDLNAIVAILAGGKIDLSNESYKFDTIDEAKEQFGSSPTCFFKISSYNPSASIDFDKVSAMLWVSGSPTARQLFHELDDVLMRCERKPRILYTSWMLLISNVPLVGSFAWPLFYAGTPITSTIQIISITLQAVLLALFIWGQYIALKRHSVILFQRRQERKTFFARNRDAILLTVITSIISGAIGYGFAKMKEGWSSSAPVSISAPETPK